MPFGRHVLTLEPHDFHKTVGYFFFYELVDEDAGDLTVFIPFFLHTLSPSVLRLSRGGWVISLSLSPRQEVYSNKCIPTLCVWNKIPLAKQARVRETVDSVDLDRQSLSLSLSTAVVAHTSRLREKKPTDSLNFASYV